MKISISKKLLESILTKLQPFLEKRDLTEITSHIYMEAKNDLVMLKATDNEIGLIAKTDNVIVEYEGKITANGKKFLKIIQTLRDEDIILELIEDSLIIKQNKSKFSKISKNSKWDKKIIIKLYEFNTESKTYITCNRYP